MTQFRRRSGSHGERAFPVGGSTGGPRTRSNQSRSSLGSLPRPPSSGIVHEGALLAHGYNLREGDHARREGLRKAVEQDGYKLTVERVNALAVVNKGHRRVHSRLEGDLKWLHETYRG